MGHHQCLIPNLTFQLAHIYGSLYLGESFFEVCIRVFHDIYFYISNRSKTLLGISKNKNKNDNNKNNSNYNNDDNKDNDSNNNDDK